MLNKTAAAVALTLGAIIVLPQFAFCVADVLARNFGVNP